MKKNKKAALTLAVLSALSNVFIGTSEAEETLMNPAGGAPILVECCCSPFLSLPCPRHLPKTAPMFCRITA